MTDYIFDLGEVLLTWNPEAHFRKFLTSNDETEELFSRFFTPEWRNRSDIYVTVSQNVSILCRRYPKWAHILKRWDTDFFEIMRDVIPENFNLIKQLKDEGHRVFGLANFSTDKWGLAQQRFPELRLLDDIVVSSDVAFRKPERKIFEIALERWGTTPNQCVFIDDSMENCQTAALLGILSHPYKSHEELRSFLHRLSFKLENKPV